jgi:Fe-Mn family superoxide dismutase
MNRKEFIKHASLMGAAIGLSPNLVLAQQPTSSFKLPALGYAYHALEPYIDARTMEIHHTKHHQAYINKLNEIVQANPTLQGLTLEQMFENINELKLTEQVKTGIRNHGGGHWNHSFFWQILKTGTTPSGKLLEAIQRDFNGLENMLAQFDKAAIGQFGSGWAWLISNKGKLSITATANQDNPLMASEKQRGTPILGIDVWEHAYYLNYQNKRADYLKSFRNVINWEQADKNFLTSL